MMAALTFLEAQSLPQVYPVPQEIKETGGQMTFSSLSLKNGGCGPDILSELQTIFGKNTLRGGRDSIMIGHGGSAAIRRMNLPIKKVPGAYYLSVDNNAILIAGFDETGVFYGLQTLRQLLQRSRGQFVLPKVTINDYPDIPFRGTVEGFYGAPWKHKCRISQIEFYGDWKLNTYIYGPKDDPFHGFSNRWREPYPKKEAEQIRELATVARKNFVNFVWAVHPGNDVHWVDRDNDGVIDDFKHCVNKFQLMYDLGVRAFAVFFDDIGGEGAKPERQAQMLNYVNQNFVKKKPDVAPLIMCPTQYNRAWSSGDYLDILGTKMDKDIAIMWTGNSVCADIKEEGTDWINNRIKRKAFIWWNWPVMDYCRTALLMGRTYGLEKGNRDKLSGFSSNPMDKPEASMVALFGVADWCWNVDAFESEKSWKDSIKILYPQAAPEMQILVNHNSDQGPNAHGYRREESVEFLPTITAAKSEYQSNGKFNAETLEALHKEFGNMANASKSLVNKVPRMNKELFHEIEFWIRYMGELGMAGRYTTQAANASSAAQKYGLLNRALFHIGQKQIFHDLQKQRAYNDTTPGDRGWVRGCKVGGLHVTPFIMDTFYAELAKNYEALSGKAPNESASAESYQVVSNVSSLSKMSAERKDRDIAMNQNFESHKFGANDFVGLMMPQGMVAEKVSIKLDPISAANSGELQGSTDGSSWEKLDGKVHGDKFEANIHASKGFYAIRFVAKSGLETKVSEFKLILPKGATFNSVTSLTDGNLRSAYSGEFKRGQTIKVPARALPRARNYLLYSTGDFAVRKTGNDLVIRSNQNQKADLYEIIPAK